MLLESGFGNDKQSSSHTECIRGADGGGLKTDLPHSYGSESLHSEETIMWRRRLSRLLRQARQRVADTRCKSYTSEMPSLHSTVHGAKIKLKGVWWTNVFPHLVFGGVWRE